MISTANSLSSVSIPSIKTSGLAMLSSLVEEGLGAGSGSYPHAIYHSTLPYSLYIPNSTLFTLPPSPYFPSRPLLSRTLTPPRPSSHLPFPRNLGQMGVPATCSFLRRVMIRHTKGAVHHTHSVTLPIYLSPDTPHITIYHSDCTRCITSPDTSYNSTLIL